MTSETALLRKDLLTCLILAALVEVLWHLGSERRALFAEVMGKRWPGYLRALATLAVGVLVYESSTWLAARLEGRGTHRPTRR